MSATLSLIGGQQYTLEMYQHLGATLLGVRAVLLYQLPET